MFFFKKKQNNCFLTFFSYFCKSSQTTQETDMHPYTDTKKLAQDLQKGEQEAYRYLFATYYPRLQRYAMHFILDSERVHDVLQDSFVRLWEKREVIDFVSVQALLFKIVRNNCLNYLRNEAIKAHVSIEDAGNTDAWEQLYNIDLFEDPDHDLLYQELHEQIDSLLQKLPERSREIFEISRFEGLKNREIAERLGISVKIVERHISRALKLLNQHINDIQPYTLQIIIIAWLNQ